MSNLALDELDVDYSLEIERCNKRIVDYVEEIKNLESRLASSDASLDSLVDERKKFDLLNEICDGLDQLSESGSASLFWNEICPVEQVDGHLSRIREQAVFLERRIKKATDAQGGIKEELQEIDYQIYLLNEEIALLEYQEDESQNEFLIEREIKELPYKVVVMPWTQKKDDNKRLRKILLITLVVSIIFSILIPIISIPIPDKNAVVKVPERLAKMVKKIKPKPVKKKKVVEEKKQQKAKKKPTKKDREKARKKVQNKGVLAFKNNLADLLDDMPEANLGAKAKLRNTGSTARKTQRSILASQSTSSSGGIKTSSLSRNVAGTGSELSSVAFSHVESGIGDAVADDRPLSEGAGPSRTDEEIQIVFDKYKAALYRIYNRELRKNPTLQGKVVLRITIDPDGKVSFCKVESADLDSKELLKKIVVRVKKFNFGDKPDVPKVTILYPIDFLPAS